MANPFSKRAQRYSDTLTRFYGLRFEKGFMLVTNSLRLGHCKHRNNICNGKNETEFFAPLLKSIKISFMICNKKGSHITWKPSKITLY